MAATSTSRDETIVAIRASLAARSGRPWSVTGGRGTAWGWITVTAPPRRREDGRLTEADRATLAELLGVAVYGDGVSIAASSAYYREYVERAAGTPPTAIAVPYWD